MLFEKIESPGLAQYSYLVGSGYEAVVIDPRRDIQIYVEKALRAGMRITHIFETHRHEDFAVGSVVLSQITGARIWHADPQLPYAYGEAVEPEQEWRIGSLKLKAIHTPGHTEGSKTYVLYEKHGAPWFVFTGDVLFTGEVGRVDFLGMHRAPAMASLLYDSIFNKIFPLGDGVILCPGHGYGSACGSSIADRPWSTIGLEKHLNPRLQFTERDKFVAEVVRELPKPVYFSKMEEWNLRGAPSAPGLTGVYACSPAEFSRLSHDAVVLDLRDISAFAGGHVPGAISIARVYLPSYVGWYVTPDQPILLLDESSDVGTAVTFLNRQGFDNILGCLSGGMLDWTVAGLPLETTHTVTPSALNTILTQKAEVFLLDVRSPEEYASGALPGAVNISHKGIMDRISEVDLGKTTIVYCAAGTRSIAATSALQRAGHKDVAMLRGGIEGWIESGLPIQT